MIKNTIAKSAYGEIDIHCIDLDNDGDNDYLFSYICGEPMCFEVYLTINGRLNKVIKEYGRISFDYQSSINFLPSKMLLKADFNHCCGESPFNSFRRFTFHNDNFKLIENYVLFDHENYCEDERIWDYNIIPRDFTKTDYSVRITKDGNNVRFSADLESHIAEFTCVENTNIIGQLKEDAVVDVLTEYKGRDSESRTWLYVEISSPDLKTTRCNSPLSYEFENQKLRGWISNKYTARLK